MNLRAESMRFAIETSFSLVGMLALFMGLTCVAAVACLDLGWMQACTTLMGYAQDMFLASTVALLSLVLLQKTVQQNGTGS